METRKVQEVGGGTYTVSIPKQWALARELEAGATVSLHTHRDGSIVIRSRGDEADAFTEVRQTISDDAAEATRTVRAAQAVGFERVTLVADAPFTEETRRAVRSLVRELVGTELVCECERELGIRNLLESANNSVGQSVVQLQYVALSAYQQAADAIADRDDTVEHLQAREAAVERLCGMVARHFSRALVSLEEVDHLGTDRPELFVAHETARELRAVAGAATAIGRAASQLSEGLSSTVTTELTAVAEDTRRAVEEAATATFDGRDVEAIHRVYDDLDAVLADVETLETTLVERLADAPVTDAMAVVRILDALSRTLEHGQAIADVALQATLRAEPASA